MKPGRPPLGSVLVHPAAAVALVVLVLNDHVLKRQYPGVLTGKLSDFAGMVVAPLVLVAFFDALAPAAMLRRRHYVAASAWASAAVVAVVFGAMKTWPVATHAYEAAFRWLWDGHVILVRDPTDLIALPMAFLAVVIARRRGRVVRRHESCSPSTSVQGGTSHGQGSRRLLFALRKHREGRPLPR